MRNIDDILNSLTPEQQALLALRLRKKRQGQHDKDTILPRKNKSVHPMSYAQKRMWFLDQLDQQSHIYNISAPLRIVGPLDVPALQKTFATIIRRHATLCSFFRTVDGEPVQVVLDEFAFGFELIDLRHVPPDQQEDTVRRLATLESRRPFDLSAGPPIRASLLELNSEMHVLLFSVHHIAFDGWSTNLLLQELQACYSGFVAGHATTLPELPIQYADYAEWQSNRLTGEYLEQELSFWKQSLEGVPELLDLPLDQPRRHSQSHKGAHYPFEVASSDLGKLKEIARAEGATTYMILLAAFQTFLFRYTGQECIAIGTPIANRTRVELERLIGFFVNTLVMRAGIREDLSFREVLRGTRDFALQAYKHQELPFDLLVDALHVKRDPRCSPLFQVMFDVLESPLKNVRMHDLDFSLLEVETGSSKFDLTLTFSEEPDRLRGMIEYNTDLFYEATIQRMAGQFRMLLASITAHPDQPIATLPLLPEAERHQVLVEWNTTDEAFATGLCTHQLIEAAVRGNPDALAVKSGDVCLTYRELNEKANKLAHYLRSCGVGPEVIVGVCVTRSPEMIVGILAVLKAGGAYLPMDASYPLERLAFMCEDSGMKVLLTQESISQTLSTRGIITLHLDSMNERISLQIAENPVNITSPQNLAYVIYTSGSTGKPKGVLLHHEGLVNVVQCHIRKYGVTEADRAAQIASAGFDASVLEIFPYLVAGASLHIADDATRSIPADLLEWFVSNNMTRSFVPTPMVEMMLDLAWPPDTSMRAIVVGGDALHRRPDASLPFKLINHYGPTENTVLTTETIVSPQADGVASPPIGKPIANIQVYILDASLQPVPIGVSGELCIGGVGLARGYLNRPDVTAEKFVPNPLSGKPGARLYRTGDLVRYLHDGNIEFLGRIDNQVKIRGFRIEPGEIEFALKQHPSINETAVVVREGQPGEKQIVAYVVPTDGAIPTAQDVRQYLKATLPHYMIPSAVVVLDALPLTSNGKVDRRALPEPDQNAFVSEHEYVPPRTPVEEMLCSIWSEVLHLDRVGIDDNFFEFGGHSLLATQVMSRIRQVLQTEVPVRVLFEAPTIRLLAQEISKSSRADSPPIVVFDRKESGMPLSFAQQRLWFLDQLEPGTAQYNIPAGIRIDGSLDEALLLRCLNEIVCRHESLRTTFRTDDATPVQVIAPSFALTLRRKDLTSVRPEIREEEAKRLAKEEATTPFSLTEGPLVRVFIIRLEEDSHLLIFTIHHIITDGWSTGVLVRELAALYRTFLNNEPSPLSPLPVQYADFAAWQRAWLQGDVIENGLAYWRKVLQNAPSSLSLPTDRPRPAIVTERGAVYPFTLSREIGHAINRLNKQEGVTTFMTLLAAFQTLLYKYTGEQDMCIGTPIANRNRVETEGLIGLFVNTLVMRGDLSGNPTFSALLARVRETALGAYAHQDMPFEKLVGAVAADRNMSHTPLFQVMFVLQNAPHDPLELPGLTMTYVPIDSGISLFDLTLVMEESAEGVTGGIEYNTDLFDKSTIERMTRHFAILLESLLNDPTQKIGSIPLLLDEEKKQLSAVNTTEARIPQCTLITLFEEQVGRTPNAVAVKSASQQLTYTELNKRANQLAHYLRRQGVGPDIPVGLCINRSLEMLVGMLGILKAGGAYVPLDPLYPPERLAFMCADAGIQQLVTQRAHAGLFTANDVAIISLDVLHNDLDAESTFNPICIAQPENLAYIIYTSGSTGTPKGVEIEHRSVINHNLAAQQEFALTARDRVLQFASLNFDAAVEEIFPTLFSGATLVLRSETVPSGDEFLTLINTEQLTVLDLPTAYWSEWLYEMTLSKATLPASLRLVIVGGERVAPERYAEWQRIAPQVRWLNTYGPTETTIISTLYEGTTSKLADVPIGRPIANTQVHVLDEFLQQAPIGVVGELCTGGMCVARGYHRRPDATAERFVPDPFSALPGARMYRTGDQVKYRDGMLYYIGRRDQQVKVRGFRVEVGEVESVLQKHPQIREAVVVVTGTIEKRLVGYYVPTNGVTIKPGDLRAFVRHELPEYMVPAVFVSVDSVPRTPSGKIDRTALPVPQSQREISETVLPRTETEQRLTEIWQRVLGVETVGIDDNFFELGGDSILSIQVVARANQLGIHLTPKQLFQSPTIAQLAAVAGTATAIQAEQGAVTGPAPLTPIQRWFFEQDFANPHHWNQSVMLEVKERLDRNLLEQTVRHLMNHHDALRMRFTKTESGWGQYNSGVVDAVPVHWIDLSATDKNERPAVFEQHANELQKSLDITHGPIIRVGYFNAGPGDTDRMLIIIHHLVVDGVSWRILVEDFHTLYTQLERNEHVVLPAKTTSFKQWAERLNEYTQSTALTEESLTWQKLLSPRLAWKVSPILLDFDNGRNDEGSSDVLLQYLDKDSTSDLQSLSNNGLGIEEVLLGALTRTIGRRANKRSMLVDIEKHGREQVVEGVDVSRTVGWFTSVFPLILDMGRTRGNGEVISTIAQHMSAIPLNGIGYGLLRHVSGLAEVRDQMERFPQSKVSFNYLGKFDGLAAVNGRFALAAENPGRERGENNLRSHPLGIDCRIIQERLEIAWSFSRNQFKTETVRHLAQEFLDDLRQSVENLRAKQRAEEEAHHFVESTVAKPSYTS